LIIIAIVFILIIPTTYLFYRYSRESNDRLTDTRINQIGREIISNAEMVYYSGKHSKSTLELNMPDNVNNVTIYDNRELVFNLQLSNGISDIIYFSDVPISDKNGCLSCDLPELADSGIIHLKLESNDAGDKISIERIYR
jgi:hypothetical protein